TWLDRAGNPLGTIGPVGSCGDPAISPDDKRILFDFMDGSNRDIWAVDIASGHQSRLTFDAETDHVPVWSPDGSRIAFESHRNGPGHLYTRSATGTEAEQLIVTWP